MSPKLGMEAGGRNDFVLGLLSVPFHNKLTKKKRDTSYSAIIYSERLLFYRTRITMCQAAET